MKMKKIISLLLTLAVIIAIVPMAFAMNVTGENSTTGTNQTEQSDENNESSQSNENNESSQSNENNESSQSNENYQTVLGSENPTEYTVTYYKNDGTSVSTQSGSTTVLNNPFSRDGYSFTGWNDKKEGNGNNYNPGDPITLESNISLFAQWKPVSPTTYTITFNANGGTGNMAPQTVTAGVKARLNANQFSCNGYYFTGWKDGNGTPYGDCSEVTLTSGNLTLYAQWSPNTSGSTVYFYANDGTGVVTSQYIQANTSTPLTANSFYRSGYTFTGWNTAANGAGTAYGNCQTISMSAGTNLVLYAQWTQNLCTVAMAKYYGGNLGRAYYSTNNGTTWNEVSTTTGAYVTVSSGTVMYFKMDPYAGYYRHPYVVNANGSYYAPYVVNGTFSVTITENKVIKLNFSTSVPTGDTSMWQYVVAALASSGTATGIITYAKSKSKKK